MSDKAIVVSNLEMHITHSCNLACESCSHYSNQNLSGKVSLEEAEQWMEAWSHRISPETFSILGGEPALHPNMADFLILARKYWKDAHLRLVSNGFLLSRHPELPKVLAADRNAKLYISIHHDAHEYRQRFAPVMQLVESWEKDYQIEIQYYESDKYWTRRYLGWGNTILPYQNGNPKKSWENCIAKNYLQLHDGMIWKCAALAYLPLLANKYNISPLWNEYLRYEPLVSACTDNELTAFLSKEDESFCSMCPIEPAPFKFPLPFRK